MPGNGGRAAGDARDWLRGLGIPSWTWPGPPGAEGAYDLLLPSGRRALVRPWPDAGAGFEDMASAGCEYLIAVVPDASGRMIPTALVTLACPGLRADPLGRPPLDSLDCLPPEEIAVLEGRPRSPRLAFLLVSLALLLAGDPVAPPPSLGVAGTSRKRK
ncbi:MAG: hypothetical protein QUS11_07915 [Candidatus Fermentibacter sp.]|nr:hypothetical protein [Candidatus Fermentibacter sp.]